MSEKHDKSSQAEEPETDGIQVEPAPFELGYQPESLPKISVPDLPIDAQSLTAEAMSQVPTLTELVDDTLVEEGGDALAEADLVETESLIQDTPVQADTWVEELHVRMGKLTDEINTLNARLDRLDEQNKARA